MNYSRRIKVIGTTVQMAQAQSYILNEFLDLGYKEPVFDSYYEAKDNAFTVIVKSDTISQDSVVEYTLKKYIKSFTKSRQGLLTHRNYGNTRKKKNEKSSEKA